MPCPVPDPLIAAYRQEAAELLGDLAGAVRDLERTPTDADQVDRALRALQTIQGSAAMFCLDELAALAHEVAVVFEVVRQGWVRMTPELIALTRQAEDHLRALLDGTIGPEHGGRARLVAALRHHLPTEESVLPAGPPLPPPRAAPEGRKTFRLRLRPHRDLFRNGTDMLPLLAELRALGRSEAVARSHALPRLEELAPEDCHLGWDVILTTDRGLNAVLDTFVFVDGRCELKVEVVDDENAGEEPETRLGQILVDRGEVSPDAVDRTLAGRQRLGELLAAQGLVTAEAVQAAVIEQMVVREERQRRDGATPPEPAPSLHLSASRLDRLRELSGELAAAQARLARIASSRPDDAELRGATQEAERVSTELRRALLEAGADAGASGEERAAG